jgi:hypothetical protein
VAQPPARVVRRGGRILLRLNPRERSILAMLLAELRAVEAPPAGAGAEPAVLPVAGSGPEAEVALDPGLARLYPPAFPDDPEAEAAFRGLVREDLEEGRRARVATVAATLDAGSLDESQAAAWLGVLNDLRLVLGTRLGVTDGSEAEPIEEGDPDAERRIVFAYLGWLLGQFVDMLEAGLPDIVEPGGEPPAEEEPGEGEPGKDQPGDP